MKLTKKIQYALSAMLALCDAAEQATVERVQLRDISHKREIPAKFLEQIMSSLAKGGLIHSQKGKNGGYGLARSASSISVAEIWNAVEGMAIDQEALEEMHGAIRQGRRESAIFEFTLEVQEAVRDLLAAKSLQELSDRTRELEKKASQSEYAFMYHI